MENQRAAIGRELFKWIVPEREHYQHSRRWRIITGLIAFVLVALAVLTSNYLFALIILIASFIIVFNEGEEPVKLDFVIGTEGISLGDKFYDYDEFRDFSVLYKPAQELKLLYFDFQSMWRRDLIIPLYDNNPLPIRENLLRYLKEDLEHTDETLDEVIGKIIKL